MVAKKEVDVRPEAAVHIAELPGHGRMLRDLGRQIPVLDRIQDAVRPLFPALASGLTEDMPHECLLGKAVGVRSWVLAPCLLLGIEVDDRAAVEPYGAVLEFECRGAGGQVWIEVANVRIWL
jgi:hypothetical protein